MTSSFMFMLATTPPPPDSWWDTVVRGGMVGLGCVGRRGGVAPSWRWRRCSRSWATSLREIVPRYAAWLGIGLGLPKP